MALHVTPIYTGTYKLEAALARRLLYPGPGVQLPVTQGHHTHPPVEYTYMRSAKKGFTLIELLIVVVIIGILAAIAIPKFASTKQKAYIASMRTDLRNLVTAEEAYFSDNTTYTNSTTSLSTSFHPSAGNTVTFGTANATGWAATSSNSFVPSTATPHSCGVWVGGVTTSGVSADTIEGAPGCA